MPFLIGTDEAGYGPNFGPLTITGASWNVPSLGTDLYQVLEGVVSPKPTRDRMTVADSKVVYQSSGSIARLETSVLATIYALHNSIPNDWQELVESVCGNSIVGQLANDPCLAAANLNLPLASETRDIENFGTRLRDVMMMNEISLQEIKCRPIFPEAFNVGIDLLGNKATVLSSETLKVVANLMAAIDGSTKIVCDKHGGRSKYASLLMEFVTDQFVQTERESMECSSYRWQELDYEFEAHFVARGESFLPTALASMVAKYVREVFMKMWNNFWQLKIPDLRPTKGYPVDAKRFKKDIESVQTELGISDNMIWRKR